MFWPDPTHQTTQAPNHPPTIHPPMGGEFFTDFKSSNGIEISRLVQVLSNFNWFWGSPGGVVDGWMGVGVGMSVWEGVPCTHTHTCMCTHARTCMLNMLNMLNMDASMLAAIWPFAILYMCVCACACVRVHVHACGDTPHAWPRYPQMPPTYLPPPQSRREPKTLNFNNSWTNWDNLILFEDSLPLDIPGLI